MGSFQMIVLDVLVDRSSEMTLAEDDHAVQTLGLNRQHESFRIRVQIRASSRCSGPPSLDSPRALSKSLQAQPL